MKDVGRDRRSDIDEVRLLAALKGPLAWSVLVLSVASWNGGTRPDRAFAGNGVVLGRQMGDSILPPCVPCP